MNLLDIRTREWNEDLLAAAGEGLGEKLGSPVSPNTLVGQVSEYMQERSVGKLVIAKRSSIVYAAFINSTVFINTLRTRFHFTCTFVFHGKKTVSYVNHGFGPRGLLNCLSKSQFSLKTPGMDFPRTALWEPSQGTTQAAWPALQCGRETSAFHWVGSPFPPLVLLFPIVFDQVPLTQCSSGSQSPAPN